MKDVALDTLKLAKKVIGGKFIVKIGGDGLKVVDSLPVRANYVGPLLRTVKSMVYELEGEARLFKTVLRNSDVGGEIQGPVVTVTSEKYQLVFVAEIGWNFNREQIERAKEILRRYL